MTICAGCGKDRKIAYVATDVKDLPFCSKCFEIANKAWRAAFWDMYKKMQAKLKKQRG